jgi:hypothetical protein
MNIKGRSARRAFSSSSKRWSRYCATEGPSGQDGRKPSLVDKGGPRGGPAIYIRAAERRPIPVRLRCSSRLFRWSAESPANSYSLFVLRGQHDGRSHGHVTWTTSASFVELRTAMAARYVGGADRRGTARALSAAQFGVSHCDSRPRGGRLLSTHLFERRQRHRCCATAEIPCRRRSRYLGPAGARPARQVCPERALRVADVGEYWLPDAETGHDGRRGRRAHRPSRLLSCARMGPPRLGDALYPLGKPPESPVRRSRMGCHRDARGHAYKYSPQGNRLWGIRTD